MEELEAESGFDRRTVAYYVQEEILPRVGRRGPRTRYPRRFLDRLLFVRRVRDLQDQGTIPPLTLAEIKEILDRLPPRTIAAVASGEEEVLPLVLGDETPLQAFEDFDAARVLGFDEHAANLEPLAKRLSVASLGMPASPELARALQDLVEQAELSRGEASSEEGRFTTVGITDNVLLTVRGNRPKVLRRAERLARLLRELLRR